MRTGRTGNGGGKRKRSRRLGASALVLALLVLSSLPALVWAKNVDTDRTCSMQISISDGEEYRELLDVKVKARLYRVAEIGRSGAFTARAAYADIQAALDGITAESTAADWEAVAAAAQKTAAAGTADASVTLTGGKGSVTGLATGLYLILADPVQTDSYSYEFSCGLVSAPGNSYDAAGQLSGEWVYDGIAVTLKPTRTELTGEIVITKTLQNYNAASGTPIAVFDVEAYYENTVVYSNVVSLVFDAANTKSVKVSGLPLGARVVVTEVYSGASYTAVAASSVTIEKLTADGAEAKFTNRYDGGLLYGTGVVNHFSYDGNGYHWSTQTDNSATDNGIRQ